MTITTMLILGIIVLITHMLEGITGFGCTVLAMPFAIMLVGIKIAKPTLTILALFLSIYVIIIAYKDIVWKEFRRIALFVGLGLPVGIWGFNKLPQAILIRILAIFMIIISIRGLYIAFSTYKQSKPLNHWVLNLILFLGGCVHGAFTSGGPLITIYATEALPKKGNFRATLCMLWVTLNGIIVIQSGLNGAITPDVLKLLGFTLPFLAVGAVLGNWAHHKIKDTFFTKIIFVVLLFSGIFMLK